MHEPRNAARGNQLGNADHRPAGPRALAAREPARARLGDPRVHDRGHGARADSGSAQRPLRPPTLLHRRLSALRTGVPGRRILGFCDGPDPLARIAGHRLGVPVRKRRRTRDRRLPAGAAWACDGRQHDGRGGRTGARTRARRRARGDWLAVGLLVQRPARAARRGLGSRGPARARAPRRGSRSGSAWHSDVHRGPYGSGARRLARRSDGLERPDRYRGAR